MKRKILLAVLLVLLLTGVFAAWKFFGPTLHQPAKNYFYVRTGQDYNSVVNELVKEKVISGKTWFQWAAGMVGYKTVKPGRYEIKNGMSVVGLVRMLRNGQQTPVNLVITKIRTREVLASRIGNAFECDSLQMINFLNSKDSLQEYGLDSNTSMVVVMPLTYTVRWNTTPGKIFEQFHLAWKTFWTDARKQKATEHGLTPIEVTTLASIIDEETNSAADKPNVASVYINRVAKGMPLQADPTIKFAMKSFALKRIYQKYLDIESPFNTYRNKGLPPGPICTPQQSTIDAVLDSPKTDYLYFVASANFDGTHVFTTNYDDHMKYARLYSQELDKRNVK